MDLSWYPRFLRKIQTNILQMIMLHSNAFYFSIPFIESQLDEDKHETIVDLCSGSSGPWLRSLNKMSNSNINPVLTDKCPNVEMFKIIKTKSNGKISYMEISVNALNTPADLAGLKTIFTGFHYFKPNEVYEIMILVLFPLTFIVSFFQFYFLSFFCQTDYFTSDTFYQYYPCHSDSSRMGWFCIRYEKIW